VAFRLVGDRYTAEDIAQDALVAAWLALPDFRRDAAFSTWLHSIVLNRARNQLTRGRPTGPLPAELRLSGRGRAGARPAQTGRHLMGSPSAGVPPPGADPAQSIASQQDHSDGGGDCQAGDDQRPVPGSRLGMRPQESVR
jgi:DNA-directed RNA polymerase specialized sigma24 family protein